MQQPNWKKTLIVISASFFFMLSFQLLHDDKKSEYIVSDRDVKSSADWEVERKFFIRDSIDEPIPKGAENVQTMPNSSFAQPLPNADLTAPVIITKMSN